MKAELTKDGCLRITPQSDLEAYALGKWTRGGKRGAHGLLEVLTEPEAVTGGIYIHPDSRWMGTLTTSHEAHAANEHLRGTATPYPFRSTPLPGIATSLPWPETSTPSTTSDGMCP